MSHHDKSQQDLKVVEHQHALILQDELSQYNESHKLIRPSIYSRNWSMPWKYHGANTPLLIDITYNTLRTSITLFNIIYPSYTTFNAIESKSKTLMNQQLVYWTVNSVFTGLINIMDIWCTSYTSNTFYQISSLALKLIPSILSPERCYNLAVRPFYRIYVQKCAEQLIQELDNIRDKANELVESHTSHGNDHDNSTNISTASNNKKYLNKKDKLIDSMHISPSVDDINHRLLNYTRHQVEHLDNHNTTKHSVIQLKPV